VGKIWVFGIGTPKRTEIPVPERLYANELKTCLTTKVLIHKDDASTYEEGC
jgi:hypothetical protein